MTAPNPAFLSANNSAPAVDAALVTPADGSDLPISPCRSIYVSVAGAIKLTTAGGTTLTIPTVGAGVLPLQCTRIWSTGTTATGIAALY